MQENTVFNPDGYRVITRSQISPEESITDEEYRFLMKRRAIPTSARDVLDIMLNAVYSKLAMPKAIEPRVMEQNPAKEQEDPFYSKANMELLEESMQQMENGQIVTKSWEELEKLAHG